MTTPEQPGAPPRTSRKVLWIVLGIVGFVVLCVVAFAAFGLYFVGRNLDMTQATATEASESFESVRARFKEAPILTIGADELVTLSREPPDTPPAERPTKMYVMAYDRTDERIVRMTVPFWMLRMGSEKLRLGSGRRGDIDFKKLHITAEELERYGPALLLDHVEGRNRVLVWTQ